MSRLEDALRPYGADAEALRDFDRDGPGLLPYASMLRARAQDSSDLSYIEGVYEWQNEPLVFLVDGGRLGDDEHRLNRLRRLVAMRGDAPYLGVYYPGTISIFRVSLDADQPSQAKIDLGLSSNDRVSTFAHLGNARPGLGKGRWISEVILKLLSSSIDDLKRCGNINDEDAISLIGRALFTRFLGDRKLLPKSVAPSENAIAQLFDSPSGARAISIWLDRTFNGDFLPLRSSLFRELPQKGYQVLGNILRKAPHGQLFLGWHERWDDLDFAHIPVGVLSQAYEHYLRQHHPTRQRKEGGFYTPRPIADLMVRGAFVGLSSENLAYAAKVLDPAAGAGVFLITVFRELVSARWKHDRKRPDTRVLREILYRQLVGFDINEAALRFAALGLYLISIELDPCPEPVRKLRFKNLRGNVLFKVGGKSSDQLGSLGPSVGPEHIGKYDLVIGNPPWSSGTRLRGWQFIEKTVATIASSRGIEGGKCPPLPNEGLDLPFVWRALQWAKSGGQIALALHARLLFQQGDGMREARKSLFSAMEVTAIVNGSELRQTKVWPEISAPFCLLYARNIRSAPGNAFRFVTPRFESVLNDAGVMRIDASSASFVMTHDVIELPTILKTLSRGSNADLDVFRRIKEAKLTSLGEYWKSVFGLEKGRPKFTGNGYQKLRPSSRIRKNGDGKPGADARYLTGLPEVTVEALAQILIDPTPLHPFQQRRIHDPRAAELFRGPLLIVHKSPPAAAGGRIQLAVSDYDLVYNETFYGYSAVEHHQAAFFVRYLALILSSQVAMWFSLVSSGEFGFEREVIEKSTIDDIPIPDFELLDEQRRLRAEALFSAVVTNPGERAWADVDQWAADLYTLSKRELQTIADTLNFNLPFADNRRRAQSAPDKAYVVQFCKSLQAELEPWARRYGKTISVKMESGQPASPWLFLRITVNGDDKDSERKAPNWPTFLGVADELAATEVIFCDDRSSTLWVARLAQSRYWSVSAARLVSQRLVWEHLSWLRGDTSS